MKRKAEAPALFCFLMLLFQPPAFSADEAHGARPHAASANHPEPFFKARDHASLYRGPGRETPPPAGVKEISIGYFGPQDGAHPEGGTMWEAVQLAFAQANRTGGIKGVPLRLRAYWSENPWGSGVAQVTRLAYHEKVWAVIGGIDGPSTHLAEQVVVKARLALLSPASSDPSINLANVPWMFSCLPDDHVQALSLAAFIKRNTASGSPLVTISSNDHDARFFLRELKRSLAEKQLFPAHSFVCTSGKKKSASKDLEVLVRKVLETGSEQVVVSADSRSSAAIVRSLRAQGYQGTVYGGACMASTAFLELAPDAAGKLFFPLLWMPDERSGDFVDAYRSVYERTPDYKAAYSYDAACLLIEALRAGELNRVKIADAIRDRSPWRGITGTIRWDNLGSNRKQVGIGTLKTGRPVPISRAASVR